MRFVILNTDYVEFLAAHRTGTPHLRATTFAEQHKARADTLFGVSDFYSRNLRKQGHEATDLFVNDDWMQAAWAREHGMLGHANALAALPGLHARGRVARRIAAGLCLAVLDKQLEELAPDVVVNLAMEAVAARWLRKRAASAFLCAQHASSLTFPRVAQALSTYDLFVSSFPPTAEAARRAGVRAAELRLGFERDILSALGASPTRARATTASVVFVGQVAASGVHASRTALLERVARAVPLDLYAPSADALERSSALRKAWRGPSWGADTYRVLAAARVSVNHHGDLPPFANNMRLYEATGVGSALVTDAKNNLGDMFEPGREVVTYAPDDAETCIAAVRRLLDDEPARHALASAGQSRTLRDHTYEVRMRELVALVKSHG